MQLDRALLLRKDIGRGGAVGLFCRLILGVAFSFSSIAVCRAGTQHADEMERVKNSFLQSLSQNYPHVLHTDSVSYFNVEYFNKARPIYDLLLKIVIEKTLDPEIVSLRISTNELGGIKEMQGGKIATVNLHESHRLDVILLRLSTKVSLGGVCESKIKTFSDLSEYWHQMKLLNPAKATALTKKIISLGSAESDGSYGIDATIAAKIKSCVSDDCILEQVFGSIELGILHIFILDKYKMNPSYAAKPSEYVNWSLITLKVLESALDEAPDLIFKVIENYNSIYGTMRFALSKHSPMEAGSPVLANATMVFYQHFLTLAPSDMKGFVMHELSHHLFDILSGEDGVYSKGWPQWNALSQWTYNQSLKKTWNHPDEITNFVSEYAGSRNPEEDFAESARVYRYEPNRLKAVSSEKYEFLKAIVFEGREFLSDSECDESHSTYRVFRENFPLDLSSVRQTALGRCEREVILSHVQVTNSSSELLSGHVSDEHMARFVERTKGSIYGAFEKLGTCYEDGISSLFKKELARSDLVAEEYRDAWLRGFIAQNRELFDLAEEAEAVKNTYARFIQNFLSDLKRDFRPGSSSCASQNYFDTAKKYLKQSTQFQIVSDDSVYINATSNYAYKNCRAQQ